MAAPWRGGSGHWGASIRIFIRPGSRPSTGRIDYLPRYPGRIVGCQPGDKAGGIFRLAPASLRLMGKHRVIYLLVCIPRIGRAGIDRVDCDTATDEVR